MDKRLIEALGSDFELLRSLGEGKQAEVYLARETSLDRLVAVKVLHRQRASDKVARARFAREAKAAASIDHPNAISVHRFGFLPDGTPYLVMQYVRGKTLTDRVSVEGPLPIPEARRILKDLSGALAEAHRRGFVHRDVRPGNVICDEESGRTLLADFGIAGLLPTGKEAGPSLTQTGELLGDMSHISPEQLSGEKATEASDIYALGILGYEMLTGEGPYPKGSAARLITAHLKDPPRDLSKMRGDVDSDLKALLTQCLAKDPKRRPRAKYVADMLADGSLAETGVLAAARQHSPGDLLTPLLLKRFPQIVVATVVGGWIVLGGVHMLVEMYILPDMAERASLVTYLFCIAASGVIAWFHGEKGKQRVRPLEIGLFSILGLAWVVVTGWIILP